MAQDTLVPASRPYEVQGVKLIAVAPGIQVREFTVTPRQEIPWHYHTAMTDRCYCLEGVVVAETRGPDGECALRLAPGASCRIEPGTVHRLINGGDVPCRYLLVQSGGEYDFNDAGNRGTMQQRN